MKLIQHEMFAVGRTFCALALGAALLASPLAAGVPSYQYNFDATPATSTQWTGYDNTNTFPAGAATMNGQGSLQLTFPAAGYYYEATAISDGASLPSAGFSKFGGTYASAGPYLGNYFQSIDIYINPTAPSWSAFPGGGFQVDGPAGTTSSSISPYLDEAQIAVRETSSGTVELGTNFSGSTVFGTITQPGWYDFVTEYLKGPGGDNGSVLNSFAVYNVATGQLVGALLNQTPTMTFLNYELGQPHLLWLPDVSPSSPGAGFANGILGIADIQAGPAFALIVPEPGSFALLATGMLGIALWLRRRRV